MNEKGLGVKIGEVRRAKGLTQQQLCQESGLSYSTLAKIERGAIKAPSVFTIAQIAAAVGVSIEDLVGLELLGAGGQNPKKRSKSGIEFVYFDVNGCLVHFYHHAFAVVASKTGVPADEVETTFWKYNDSVCRGDMPLDEFDKILSDRFKFKRLNWREYYMEAVESIQETFELVTWTAKYYRVGLLSNIMPGFIDEMIDKGLLPRIRYDAVIDSSETGYIKPEKEIYEVAQKAAGTEPERILFVDDSRTNIMAAGQLGWHVLWFDDSHPVESVQRVKQSLEF